MLYDFISQNRLEIIERTRAKVTRRGAPRATKHEIVSGIPLFLTHLSTILEDEASHPLDAVPSAGTSALGLSATEHGRELLQGGCSIAQVVYDYGDLCQAITELAVEYGVPIATRDFQTLNECLDNGIANAVTEYARQRDVDTSGEEIQRRGFFAHELRNHLQTALLTFQAVKSGKVGLTGSTTGVLERSLRGLGDLIDRSVSEVRLDSGAFHRERVAVTEFVEELEIAASIEATQRELQFGVERLNQELFVEVDRQLFASAISNLLQNAFKFTRPLSHVWLRTRLEGNRVSIEIEDECGGLTPGATETLFQPYEQRAADRSGLGLGLAISRRAIEADGGRVTVRNLPGKGCVFTVAMPLAPR
ncbi:MAG TPA: HAMP domain-containing sensor histidine kinase [Candidatus Polarisedimenticolia bacterium]|nr:HAMP domain-containing sensor histidine kinase [Candidatus Polarisedimenticolia bacterium]